MEVTVLLHQLALLDAETAMRVLTARVERRVPVGRLAQERGLLTAGEVARVLVAQAESRSGLRFGEMAMSLGLLDVDELAWLLREQARILPSELELAVELGGLDRAELEHVVGAHRARGRAAA